MLFSQGFMCQKLGPQCSSVEMERSGAKGMVQWLKAIAVLAEKLVQFPVPKQWLITASVTPILIFAGTCIYIIYTHAYIYIYT